MKYTFGCLICLRCYFKRTGFKIIFVLCGCLSTLSLNISSPWQRVYTYFSGFQIEMSLLASQKGTTRRVQPGGYDLSEYNLNFTTQNKFYDNEAASGHIPYFFLSSSLGYTNLKVARHFSFCADINLD